MTTEQIYALFLVSDGIITDTRNLEPNKIFVALKGEHFNGNLYAQEALEKGCTYAIVDEKEFIKNDKYILVDDSLKCLQNLARIHRQTFDIPVIAITGSNGKTTTKELITTVLGEKFDVHSTKGNLNNHLGVPLTLLSMRSADIAIIEMGANHLGEIAELCKIANPNFGIITNIGKAHLEGFGSLEGVISTKSELYKHIRKTKGKVFLNGENELLTKLAKESKLDITSYFSGKNLICDGFVVESNQYIKIVISFSEGKRWKVNTNLIGKYNLENILAAAAIGKYFGVDEEKIITAIQDYQPDNNRSQILKTKNNTLILDAYNANPTSMNEALINFSDIDTKNKTIILGDMFELGEYAKKEHLIILKLLKILNFKEVFLVGPEFKSLENEFNYNFFSNIDDLNEHLTINKVYKQYILLKASRGIQLEKLVKIL